MIDCPHCDHGTIWTDDKAAACPHCLLARLRDATDGWSGDAFAVGDITATAAADEIEKLRLTVKPFAKLGAIILAEAPPAAKTIVMFTSASGEKFSMQLDYFRDAIRALEALQ
jgi:hypothetical protein